jgi:hypothetical protein
MEPNNPTLESVWAAIQETQRQLQENSRSHAETEKVVKELAEDAKRLRAERAEDNKRLRESMREMHREIGGIGKSNGGFAEEYIFNSLKDNLNLFGEKFDRVAKNVPAGTDNSNLDGEFDIVYYNCKAIAIVEIKYMARFFNVLETLDKVETFRINFPDYDNHKIYLAMAAMYFDKDVEEECTYQGIAVIKQNGGNLVINDKHIKAF